MGRRLFERADEVDLHPSRGEGELAASYSLDYRTRVLDKEVKQLGHRLFSGRPWLFQQDGAPAHTALATRAWFQQNNIDYLAPNEWPPSSPDLNVMDFCIWSILEAKVCAQPHLSLESLKKSLRRAWNSLDISVLRKACQSVPSRLRAVKKAKGGFIEKS